MGAQVRCHDDNAISKVNLTAVRVCQVTFVEELKKKVPHITVPLLELIQQDHLIRTASNALGQDASFIVTNIPWRGTNQTRDSMPGLGATSK